MDKSFFLTLGIVLGALAVNIGTHFGEQRYSDAIKACIIEKGPNK